MLNDDYGRTSIRSVDYCIDGNIKSGIIVGYYFIYTPLYVEEVHGCVDGS